MQPNKKLQYDNIYMQNWEHAKTVSECEEIIEINKNALIQWQKQNKPIIVMCAPDYFNVTSEFTLGNEFRIEGAKEFNRKKTAYLQLIQQEWMNFKTILESQGAQIVLLTPKNEFTTQVFTADPMQSYTFISEGQAINSITLFSKFAHPERINEVQAVKDLFRNLKDELKYAEFFENHQFIQMQESNEGTGDNLFDPYRGILLSGYGLRNSKNSIQELQKYLPFSVYDCRSKPPFFHLDTYVSILPGGYVMYCPEVMPPETLSKIERIFFKGLPFLKEKYGIIISKEDAYHFVCNTVTVNNRVIMQPCSEELLERLLLKNIQPIFTPANVANLCGGGLHCMTNRLNQPVFC